MSLARGFIEVHAISHKHPNFVAIDHIARIRTMPYGNPPKYGAELFLSVATAPNESTRFMVEETTQEVMTLINKERELIRLMEKAAS